MLRQLYPSARRRARALGLWSAGAGLALAAGPVLGGLLVELAGWRAVFWFSLALGGVLLVASARWLPHSADPRPGRFDLAGTLLAAVAIAAAVGGGVLGEQQGYTDGGVITLFVVAVLAGAVFLIVEGRVGDPVLDPRLLRDRGVLGGLITAFAVYFSIFAIFFLAALYLDLVIGWSGTKLAAVFVPMAAAIVLGSIGAGRWVAAIGYRAPMIAGSLVSTVGILLTRSALTQHPSAGLVTLSLLIAGLGFGVAVVPLTAAVLGRVPSTRSGSAAAATTTARQLGTVVGVTVLGALVDRALRSDFGGTLAGSGGSGLRGFVLNLVESGGHDAAGFDIAHPPALLAPLVDAAKVAFRAGLQDALLVAAILSLVAAAVAALLPRGRRG